MKTTFQKLIEYINQHDVGEIIFRKNILKEIDLSGKMTIDTYRITLTRQGYLKTTKRGQYKILKKVPIFLNTDGKTFKETPIGMVLRIWDESASTKKESQPYTEKPKFTHSETEGNKVGKTNDAGAAKQAKESWSIAKKETANSTTKANATTKNN